MEIDELEQMEIDRIVAEARVEPVGRVPWFEMYIIGVAIYAIAAATVTAVWLW